MSDMAMVGRHDGEGGGTKGAAMMAIILWVVVAIGLLYGLVNTLKTVADLFSG